MPEGRIANIDRVGSGLDVMAALWSILIVAVLAAGCDIPNLDPPECSASRTSVREFYSFHFGNEMKVSADGLEARRKFITPELFRNAGSAAAGSDPFTSGTADIPKAFRAGKCTVVSPDRTQYDILLFWKDDVRSEQRTIRVQAVKTGDQWLIDRVEQ